MTLTDDETAPTAITLTVSPASVREDDSATAVTVTATLDGSVTLSSATEVAVMVGGGTAASGTDYATVADFTLTIAATESTGTGTFTLTPTQDSIAEGDETIDVTGSANDFTVTKATMTLTDDETAPGTITLAASPASVGEDASATQVTVTATLDGSVTLAGAMEVTVSVGGGTATSGTDYTAVAPVTLTIAAGQATATASFMVTPVDDAVDEEDETMAVSGVTAAPELPVTPATLTLGDDDERGVTVQPTELHMRPGERKSYTVRLSSQPTATATVRVIVPPDRAADLTVEPATLTFTRATWQTRQTVTVTATDSDAPARATRLELEHAVTGGDYDQLPAPPVKVSIADSSGTDVDPPALTIADVRTVESAGRMAFTVQLASAGGRLVTVDYATVSGTATEGADYTGTTGTLTFRPGGALTRTIAVPIVDDALDEVDETFRMRLSDARHATLAGGGAALAATGTILDDDEPAVSIVADAAAVQEGQAARFTVTRTGHATEPLAVKVEVTETGRVIAGEPPTEVTFAANVRTAALLVPTDDDTTDEPDGAVTATLAAGAGYVTADPVAATVTVTDNDAAPEITIADARVLESAGAIEFTVRMAAASGHRVTVTCVSEDGTAQAGKDYVAEIGVLTLEPGQTSAVTRVAVLDDTLDEMDETFTMMLSDPAHATLADATATGTIEDDDVSVERAWLARFGRAVATHVVDAVDGRMREDARRGGHTTLAGRRLQPATEAARTDGVEPVPFRTMEFRELLAGSAFQVPLLAAPAEAAEAAATAEAAEAGAGGAAGWTAWGRGGATQLAGAEGELSVGGQVASGVVGADYDWGNLLAGVSVAYSRGGGEYTVRGSGTRQERTGDLQSWLLSAHPYARVKLTDRLQVWGLLGYGLGRMSLAEGGAPGRPTSRC